jgi:Ohr subfamily peroxiredoxin
MTSTEKIIYTGKTHTTSGGRNGSSRSSDGRLDIGLSSPGSTGTGTNPEQLLGAAWSACFIGAIGKAADKSGVALPDDLAVDAEIDLVANANGYDLKARLNVSIPGVDPGVAMGLLGIAHQTCPYSKATRGNIDVAIRLV